MAPSRSYGDQILLDRDSRRGLQRDTRTPCYGEKACTWCDVAVKDHLSTGYCQQLLTCRDYDFRPAGVSKHWRSIWSGEDDSVQTIISRFLVMA
jgi:hypothetical protein